MGLLTPRAICATPEHPVGWAGAPRLLRQRALLEDRRLARALHFPAAMHSPPSERRVLLLVGAIQLVDALDFMMWLPP